MEGRDGRKVGEGRERKGTRVLPHVSAPRITSVQMAITNL